MGVCVYIWRSSKIFLCIEYRQFGDSTPADRFNSFRRIQNEWNVQHLVSISSIFAMLAASRRGWGRRRSRRTRRSSNGRMRPDEMVVNNGEQRRAAETMSETSEGTATTSVSGKSGFESREDLRDLATMLGIGDEDLHQERFRVDRRKLEQMLLGEWRRGRCFRLICFAESRNARIFYRITVHKIIPS